MMGVLMPYGLHRQGKSVQQGESAQQGQALLESLIAALGLAVLWVAISWLAHYQDAALSATHASRYAAFAAARYESFRPALDIIRPFFTGNAHRWKDRKGSLVLDSENDLALRWSLRPLSSAAQPGQAGTVASALRHDWALDHGGILQAHVEVSMGKPHEAGSVQRPLSLRLDDFEGRYPFLARSTAILTGSGHADSDHSVQTRVAGSGLAWSASYDASVAAAGAARLRTAGVDQAWGRPAAGFDWLRPWSGYVPDYLLDDPATEGGN